MADRLVLCIGVSVCVCVCQIWCIPSQSGHSEYYMWPAGAMGRGNEGLLEGEREREKKTGRRDRQRERQETFKLEAM